MSSDGSEVDCFGERRLTDKDFRDTVAKDVREIRNILRSVKHFAIVWGFVGGLIPALLMILLSVMSMGHGK